MERRMRRKSHVRCEAGEKAEITSKFYLSHPEWAVATSTYGLRCCTSYDRFLNRILKDSDDGGLVTELDNLYQLPTDVQDAARMLISTLKEGRSEAFIDVSGSKRTYTLRSSFRMNYERVEGDLKRFMDNHIKSFDDYTNRNLEFYEMYNKKEEFKVKRKKKRGVEIRKMAEALSQYHYEITGELVTLIPYTSDQTRYYNVAIELDRGKIGKYWSSNVELAARAFEYYVSEKLKENHWRNDYLVCGLDSIYPFGEEGQRIKEAMALFMQATLPYLTKFREEV